MMVLAEEEKSVGAESNDTGGSINFKCETSKDEKLVVCSRIFVVVVMTILAFILSLTAYRVISDDEHDDFIAEFEASAGQVAFMTKKYAENVHTSLQTMATAYPSTVTVFESDAVSFPMVTLVNFDELSQGARSLAKVSAIWYAPFFTTEKVLANWNNYTYNYSNTMAHRVDQVYRINNVTGHTVPEAGDGIFSPLWQVFPTALDASLINFNLASDEVFAEDIVHMVTTGQPVLSKPLVTTTPLLEIDGSEGSVSLLLHPVFSSLDKDDENRAVVGFLTAVISWLEFLTSVLPPGKDNIFVVVESCGVQNTFVLHGAESKFVGHGDLHNPLYDDLKVFVPLDFGGSHEKNDKYRHCYPTINIFPTDDLKLRFGTSTAFHYATIIVVMFVAMGIVFLVYDWFVTNRQTNTEHMARKTNAIVQELFPGNVAAKLYNSKDNRDEDGKRLPGEAGTFSQAGNSAIAQLHPSATVLFADIAGFTAWSSMRDPHQVFTLLESIFQAFDAIAKKRDIFKVETIGDCYVAVCGVPNANPQHAVQMARFARTAMDKFDKVIRSLELKLGPDTVDLGMRVGMHSGPVTAGVLRGERARFQLFGDTVNTAARIESTGIRDRIHLSEQTATELINEGKQDWIVARDDVVEAKGKGKLKTFWLKSNAERVATSAGLGSSDTSESESSEGDAVIDSNNADQPIEHHSSLQGLRSKERQGLAHGKQQQRLVEWNTALLLELLRQVVEHRGTSSCEDIESTTLNLDDIAIDIAQGRKIVDEVTDTIQIPIVEKRRHSAEVRLSGEVANQIRRYVGYIASLYNNHPFHNFEHASHVTMSVSKLLSRIVDSHDASNDCSENKGPNESYMIKPDPLTQFAVVLAALVHDVDHAGVSNAQLVAENPILANLYDNRCVAEQNSVDVAWKALMSSDYDDLRAAIFSTEAELRLFRQIIVNTVMATDIFDEDLSASRKLRWKVAFVDAGEMPCEDLRHHQAAIVTDSLMQASDVAHTMQHWQVFQKWNQRLFDEMLTAFRNGRCDKDPTESWYEGELSFFDNTIIPLAQKLKDCGVFGVSGEEYLTYARQNRSEWEVKGHAIVHQYGIDYEKKQAIGKNSTGRGSMIRRGSMRVIRTARHWFADSERSLNESFS